jgi:hypothetical protein
MRPTRPGMFFPLHRRWPVLCYRWALDLSKLVDDRERFRARIRDVVKQVRATLRLEADVELLLIVEPPAAVADVRSRTHG